MPRGRGLREEDNEIASGRQGEEARNEVNESTIDVFYDPFDFFYFRAFLPVF